MPKKTKSATQKENSAEIDGDAAMLEIARLQEQVKLLTIEVKVLRSQSGQETLNTTTNHFENKSAKGTSKGCSCKGNCSTKICGCTKRDKKCDHLCKCNESCQNQGEEKRDRDKDADGDYDEHKFHRRKHLDTSDNVKGLFSPVTNKKGDKSTDQYKIPSITFDSSKILNFSSSSEEYSPPVVPAKTKNARAKSQEKEAAPRSGRLLKKSLKPTDTKTQTTQRSRSTSNENRKTKKKNQDEVHDLRKSASCESGHFTDDSNDPPLVAVPNSHNYLKNIADGCMMPLRRKKLKESDENKGNSGVPDNETLDSYKNDPHFDPTKPKKQLARTPTRSSNEPPTPSPTNRVSDIPLPPPVPESDEDDCPPPPELKEVNVDWNEHLAQRVPCGKCGRKFYPDRIKKHRAVCKGL